MSETGSISCSVFCFVFGGEVLTGGQIALLYMPIK